MLANGSFVHLHCDLKFKLIAGVDVMGKVSKDNSI